MKGLLVVCTIFYGGYNPFNFTQYQKMVVTHSTASCTQEAQKYYRGTANFSAYDVDDRIGRIQFETHCGVGGKDCPLVP